MAITAYTGLPGHGKSYNAILRVAIEAIKAGKRVFTNIPLQNLDKWVERYGGHPEKFETEDIVTHDNFWNEKIPPGAVVIIDELWKIWPAGMVASKIKMTDKAFLAEHRHLVDENGNSTEIVLVTQDMDQIASFAKLLIVNIHDTYKLEDVGRPNNYIITTYSGNEKKEKSKRNEVPGTFKKEIYDLYVSHTKSEHGAGKDTKTDKNYHILKGWKVKVGFIFVLLMLAFIYWGFGNVKAFFHPESKQQDQGTTQQQTANSDVAPNLQLQPPGTPPVKEEKPDILKRASAFFIDKTSIKDDHTNYSYQVNHSGSFYRLTNLDFESMGYQVNVVNECLVILSINNDDYFIGCFHEKKKTFTESLVPVN